MTYQFLDYDVSDFIGRLCLNRPPVNALNHALVAELASAADQICDDVKASRVRAVVITAKGKHFCAGADLKERLGMKEEDVGPTVRSIGNSVKKLAEIPVPTIAALQGSAFGGGFEVALAADIRVAVESAQMGLRETALAIIPGAGGTQRLTRLIGPGNAMLWITTARMFSAREALQHGAINLMVQSPDELLRQAEDIAADIAKCGPLAVQNAKRAILGGLSKPLDEALDFEFQCYQNIISTKDRIEGLNAFKEKRQPDFTGS